MSAKFTVLVLDCFLVYNPAILRLEQLTNALMDLLLLTYFLLISENSGKI